MMGLLLLLVGVLGQWLLGVVIASVILRGFPGRRWSEGGPSPLDKTTSTELAGLGLIIGIGATAGILFLWSLCGGPLGSGISIAITIIGLLGGGFVVFIERRGEHVSSEQTNDGPDSVDHSRVQCWCRICQFAIACLFAVTLIQTLMRPQHLWDERASFAIKGIVAWEDHSIHSRDLADPNFVQYHPRYPLLIPLAELHVYSLLGAVDDRLSKIIFPLLYLGMVLTVAGALQRQFTKSTAWLFGLLIASIPSLVPWEYGFVCGQADAPTACYHGSSVLYLWIAWQQMSRENPVGSFRFAVVAGLCGAFAAFTKDEGISYLLVDGIAMLLVTVIFRHKAIAIGICTTAYHGNGRDLAGSMDFASPRVAADHGSKLLWSNLAEFNSRKPCKYRVGDSASDSAHVLGISYLGFAVVAHGFQHRCGAPAIDGGGSTAVAAGCIRFTLGPDTGRDSCRDRSQRPYWRFEPSLSDAACPCRRPFCSRPVWPASPKPGP